MKTDIPHIDFNPKESNSSGFEILKLSNLFERMPDFSDHNPNRRHRISFFALLIVTEGDGTHEVDLKKYDLKEGVVLKLAKGQVHAFQNKPQYEGFLIIFTETFIINYFSKSSINLISHFYNYHLISPFAEEKSLNSTFLTELINEVNHSNNYARGNIVSALINLYLLRLERNSKSNNSINSNSKHYMTFIEFKNLVETKFVSSRNVKDYAGMLNISTKHLNNIVQEFTLTTAKNFIDDYVVLEIKRGIVSTDNSLKEISYLSGFDEVTNFSKFFKNRTGVTPKEFRLNRQ